MKSDTKIFDLSKEIVEFCKNKNIILSTTESCTGGGLASSLLDISGASNIFKQGYVTYSNQSKIDILGVLKETIENFGVVSSEVAFEMASNLKKITSCNVAISTTGNLGPDVCDNKKVGCIFVGFCFDKGYEGLSLDLDGDRLEIKNKCILSILTKLKELLNKYY